MKTKVSFLFGITTGRWLRLLWQNGFRISPRYAHNALLLTGMSMFNSVNHFREKRRYQSTLSELDIKDPPIFIMGHWRSGTTHLHNILNLDPQLAATNTYEAMFPHTFLTTEDSLSKRLDSLIPAKRPQDNMAIGWDAPQEDEIAMSSCTVYSPALIFSFPGEEAHYEKYFTFRGAPEDAIRDWQQAFLTFAKKLYLRYGRSIVFKSPLHTCRIRILLELFPEARFVHIIRNPYRVFQSTVHMFKTLEENFVLLQRPPGKSHSERVLRIYEQMHEAYFDELDLIPPGRFHLIKMEDLQRDPLGEMSRLYETLNIPGFPQFESRLREYIDSLTGYRQNRYPYMKPAIRDQIAARWQKNFLEWDYPLELPEDNPR
jgi:hypothetical protein